MIKVLFPICTLNWRVNDYVSRQGKDINRRNENILMINNFVASWYYAHFEIINCLLLLKPFFLIIEKIGTFVTKLKNHFSVHN